MTRSTPLGRTLASALAAVRAEVADPVAPAVVLVPSDANAQLARQQLALATPFIRVDVCSPEAWLRDLAQPVLAARGLRPEPAGWLRATVADLIRSLGASGALGPAASTLAEPGWSGPVARAVDLLEASGVVAERLSDLAEVDHADRRQVLSMLLAHVAARRAEDGLYTRADLCAVVPQASPRWACALVLGDRRLGSLVHEALSGWLGTVPHAAVQPSPWLELERAPLGLRAAVTGPTWEAPTVARPALVRTPDDVRELAEATRTVLDAARRGVPLDRIAIVVPDAAEVDVLRGHLSTAGVPATWLVGPPLHTRPAAGFLLHVLEMVTGDDTVPAWYELLRQPGLQLRSAVAADVTGGSGRWRRILGDCGAVRDTSAIVGAVEAWAAAVDDMSFDPEADRRAAVNLVRAMTAVGVAMDGLRGATTLGGHARRWMALLRALWVPSPDREQVLGVLQGWGPPGLGATWRVDEVLPELRDALAQAMALEGRLADPAIRIGTPMALLGGAFEWVAVTGLTEGRFPRAATEDPLLPDGLVDQLNQALGTALPSSRELASFERRRFAAALSACDGDCWLSSPATELLEERPLLPSRFLLGVASERLGRRARYADLGRMQVEAGSRAHPWADAPDRALGALEHRVASAMASPGPTLRQLAHHAVARGLLGLQRALDQADPSPWTTLLPPGMLEVPGLDGAALSPWRLATLVKNPGAFLTGTVLGVRRLRALAGASDLGERYQHARWILAAVEEGLASDDPTPARCLEAWDHALSEWRAHRVDVDDAAVDVHRRVVAHTLEELWAAGLVPAGARRLVSGAPVAGLPWRIESEVGWIDGPTLSALRDRTPSRGALGRDAADLVLCAMVADPVAQLRVAGLDQREIHGDVDTEREQMGAWLERVTECVRAGYWPVTKRERVHLGDEPVVDLHRGEAVPDVLRALEGGAP